MWEPKNARYERVNSVRRNSLSKCAYLMACTDNIVGEMCNSTN